MTRLEIGLQDIGLLLLRLGAAALLLVGHGWPKVQSFAERSATFPDPLGVGSPMSLGLVVFAEVVCSLLVAFGLLTRLAVVPVLLFFTVAVLVHHADDPWARKELGVVFALPFLVLLLTGPGRLSVDAAIARARVRRALSMER